MNISGYRFQEPGLNCAHAYLLPTVLAALQEATTHGLSKRVFELGCGNGAVAQELHRHGYELVGVDPSSKGIEIANRAFPHLRLSCSSSESDLAKAFGTFPIVLSLEVIEHVFAPREFVKRIYDLLEIGGLAVISTPYNGYLKNLAVALLGKCDQHYTALWDNGHIKFWSVRTLSQLLSESGFKEIRFCRVGRIPPLAKSMIALARK